MVEYSGMIVQTITTSRKPSRVCSSRLFRRESSHSAKPDARVAAIATSNARCAPSAKPSEMASGSRKAQA